MAKSKIYTRKGDEGLTSLVGGKRIPKNNIRIDGYGTIDELNSFISCLLEEIDNREDRDFLLEIQSKLFTLGSYLASEVGFMDCTVGEEDIQQIEAEIDKIDADLPLIKNFILPGGCKANAFANVCRTICRRAERIIYQVHTSEKVDENALKYINRLSDYFFLLGRKQNYLKNISEIIWKNTCK